MLTMYPERLKKRKRDVELEISERPGKKKYRKIDPDETTECPNCDKQIKTKKLGLRFQIRNRILKSVLFLSPTSLRSLRGLNPSR